MKNKVLENIYTRRSVRDYLDKQVSKQLVEELLNAAVMAPSANNTQPWHFTIIEGRKNIDRLAEKALPQYNLARNMDLKDPKIIFYNAPLLIFISGRKDYFWLKADVNLAVQNMFLAAHSLGLGSCWIGRAIHLNNDPETLRELGVPEGFEIAAALIFGYPKKVISKIPERKPKILKWIS